MQPFRLIYYVRHVHAMVHTPYVRLRLTTAPKVQKKCPPCDRGCTDVAWQRCCKQCPCIDLPRIPSRSLGTADRRTARCGGCRVSTCSDRSSHAHEAAGERRTLRNTVEREEKGDNYTVLYSSSIYPFSTLPVVTSQANDQNPLPLALLGATIMVWDNCPKHWDKASDFASSFREYKNSALSCLFLTVKPWLLLISVCDRERNSSSEA